VAPSVQRPTSTDAVAALLKKYPTYPVLIIGHTDSRGRHGELAGELEVLCEENPVRERFRAAHIDRFGVRVHVPANIRRSCAIRRIRSS